MLKHEDGFDSNGARKGIGSDNEKPCRLCNLPELGSNQARPDGSRACKCPDLSPCYKPTDPVQHVRTIDQNSETFHPKCFSDPQHEKTNITEDLPLPNDESYVEEKEKENGGISLKMRTFIPPQGMDAGQYPRALFYQYYPKRKKSYTFDVLPLPFLDKLDYQGMIALSMNNEEIRNNWQEFLDNLPNSESKSLTYPDEKFWRWKIYLRYKPDEIKNDYRYKMTVGPKYDDLGRLPIAGEDLRLYRDLRVMKSKPNAGSKYGFKKDKGGASE